ncbi:T9SS type A sorting domain-containing protein [candidate division KSB1 bacterium]|nr:T9SS type A sorting domain-containing protein [candidate division KSB1 bacterium]
MKSTYFFCILFLLLSSSVTFVYSQEPIVFSASDIPNDTSITWTQKLYKGESISVDLGSAGENQVWDFTGYDLPITEHWEALALNEAPYGDRYPNVSIVFKVTTEGQDTVVYNYLKLTDTQYFEMGQVKRVGSKDTQVATPADVQAKVTFPVTYGTQGWMTVSRWAASVEFGGFPINATLVDTAIHTIDAWGTVKTPLGDLPCLRVKQIHRSQADLGVPGFEIPIDNDIIYSWISPGFGFVVDVYSQQMEVNENFTEARQISVMSSFNGITNSVAMLEQPLRIHQFDLEQNYPNPFNPSTKIAYELHKQTLVILRIFNQTGQLVETLVSEYQQPGRYAVDWNAANLPSGHYYYQLETLSQRMTRQAILIK